MKKCSAWIKLHNDGQAVEDIMKTIRTKGFSLQNMQINKTLDSGYYHVNLEIEGSQSTCGLSEQISTMKEVDKFELSCSTCDLELAHSLDMSL